MKKGLRSTIFLIIIVAALIGSAIIWYNLFTSGEIEPVTSASADINGLSVGSQSLLQLLSSLEGLNIDLSILDDPLYKGLRDFTPDISAPEIRGRLNPFEPLEELISI